MTNEKKTTMAQTFEFKHFVFLNFNLIIIYHTNQLILMLLSVLRTKTKNKTNNKPTLKCFLFLFFYKHSFKK